MIEELNKILDVKLDFDLSNYNTYKLESTAKVFLSIKNTEELKKVIDVLDKYKSKWFVIGNGSNIILPSYYNGVVIKLEGFDNYEIKADKVIAESCCMINKLANNISNLGYKGLEWACGVPGTIGGSVCGNAGCYGSSISNVLESCTVLENGKIKKLKNSDLMFDYRTSMLKENKNIIVLDATFKIEEGDKEILKSFISEKMEARRKSQDLTHPSNGSVFRNPEGFSAGKLIDDLGLKGYSIGGASISTIHANFIINNGNAKSEDIINLIDYIKQEVKKHYDIDLVLEQEIIK